MRSGPQNQNQNQEREQEQEQEQGTGTGMGAIIEELDSRCELVHYRPGEYIYLPGDPCDAIYLICKGKVRLSFLDEEGERQTVALLGEGELFGELVLDGARPREFIAEALTETSLYLIDKWHLPWLLRRLLQLGGLDSPNSQRLSELLGYRRELVAFWRR